MQERIVYIRRVEKNDKTRLPKDLLMDSKRPIGASYNKFGQILKGITGEEEKKIMPEIIGISVSDPQFSKACEAFWCNITIPIPPGMGIKLNVGLDANGYPVAPMDYAKYKFAKAHRNVAPEENVDANPYALFYIHDPVSSTLKKASELDLRNKAKLKYLELIQDEKRMDDVLSVLTSYRNPAILSSDDKKLILESESTKKPVEFVKAVEDDKLAIKSFVYRCINAGVFRNQEQELYMRMKS
jgi:hypothetical protein